MTSTIQSPCPPWRRLCALIYDLLAVVAIVMVVGFVCQLATGGRLIAGSGHDVRIAWWYQPLQGLVVAGYFLFSWCRGGQTLGMRPWRIRLRDARGNAVALPRGVVRLLVAALPLAWLALASTLGTTTVAWAMLATWTLWFLPTLFDAHRRALHDLVAGTELRRCD
jgi:uncharacterized RDD family membrane protein YckC